ncbi:MAG: hypothetical protein IJ411_04110 [Oscillospiraceae bacterium]|nr:hypothetical protein [Oscillospiraceae bacterium]
MKQKWIRRGLSLILALLMVGGVLFSALPVSASSTSKSKEETVLGIKMASVKGYPKIVFYDAEGQAIQVNGETELSVEDQNLSFTAHEFTYQLSKSSRIKRNYSYVDLILSYADTSYPLISDGNGAYKNVPDKKGAKACINYDGYEFISNDIDFAVSNNRYLIVKAYFNGVDFFNTYTNDMVISFEYTRADGSSVSGGDDYRMKNLQIPDKVVIKNEDDDDDDWYENLEKDEDGNWIDPETGEIVDPDDYEGNDDNSSTITPVDVNSSTPYVIVEEYSFAGGSTQVAAGSSFNLNLSCRNTHAKIDLENIIMKVTAAEGLQLTSSSNTFYIDRLKRSAGFEKDLNVSALSSAEAKSYILKIEFSYEYIADGARKKGEMSQEISIPVVQTDRFSADPITEVAEMTVGDEIDIVSKYMNKSRGQLYNLSAEMICDESIRCDESIQHSGNLQAGASGEMEFALSGSIPGTYSCEVVYTYEDALGNSKETRVPFEITFVEAPTYEWDQPVMEEFPIDDTMYDEFGNPIDPMAEQGLTQNQMLLIGGAALAVIVLAAVLIRKRKKAKEFEDDDENF